MCNFLQIKRKRDKHVPRNGYGDADGSLQREVRQANTRLINVGREILALGP
jgi:hypothetical protein